MIGSVVAMSLLMLLLVAFPSLALEGRVVGVHDGDTLTLLTADRQETRVRLAAIDAPERDQPYGARAKQVLSALVFGRTVRVVEQSRDTYGRLVGRVYVGTLDVSTELVKQGAAWVYRRYATEATLPVLEAQAQAGRWGLWALPASQRLPPWEWRHLARAGSETEARVAAGWRCGAKQSCGEMGSCEEARFYLRRCGLRRLDRDEDGRPCERLCFD